jgi:hypothetical protein
MKKNKQLSVIAFWHLVVWSAKAEHLIGDFGSWLIENNKWSRDEDWDNVAIQLKAGNYSSEDLPTLQDFEEYIKEREFL